MLRLARLLAHLAWGLALAAWISVGGARRMGPERLAHYWCRGLLAIFRVHLRVEGVPLAGAHLTVANHVSWLDIPVMAALAPTRFVAKSEVRNWPVVGWLARAAGTFFIRRGQGGARPLLERLVPHLRASGCAVVFPEGTTTDGSRVLPFHARLFAAAVEADCPVQPVTLQYGLAANGEDLAPFVGNDALVPHLFRLLRYPGLQVRVRYSPPIRAARDRDALAAEAESLVRAGLLPPPRAALPAVHGAAAPDPV